ncbi:MAG: ABC transporter permease [Clostridiales bacterium]|nr:ABC transporter permease [Clostridiales bacterium]
MAKYIMKRIGYAIATLFVLSLLTFFMMRALPGDPFIGERSLPDATMKALEAKYGLDKPVMEQFLIYMKNALHGDFGVSMSFEGRGISDIIADAFPYSFDLGIRSLIFATIMGILLGTLAAVKRESSWDTVSMLIAIIGVSIPSFLIGALLQYIFGVKLKWLPVTGWKTFKHTLLPSFALSFGSIATISRLMRTSMLDVLGQDYIKTAKSKGLSQSKIIWKHAVRNAIMPVITVLGPIAAGVLTGTFVIENLFAIPGLGKMFVLGVQQQDYTLISGTTLFYGAFLIIACLIVDLLYGLIDPRVKLTGGKE